MKPSMSFLIIIFFCCSCNEADHQLQYPRTFVFNHSTIIHEKAYVIGVNNSFVEIDSKAGNLQTLRDSIAFNLYRFIRNSGFGIFIESIELLENDSLKLNIWQNGFLDAKIIHVNIDSVDGKILDLHALGSKFSLDENMQELNFCISLSLAILGQNGTFVPEIIFNPCQNMDINEEFQKIMMEERYEENDTLGVYLLNMVYK